MYGLVDIAALLMATPVQIFERGVRRGRMSYTGPDAARTANTALARSITRAPTFNTQPA